jgi:hypothetical protein
LEQTKAQVLALRQAEKEAEARRVAGLKEVKALMRALKVTVSDLTDPKFA